MARLETMPEYEQKYFKAVKCPTFETTPWVQAPPLHQARVAVVTTAGLHRSNDRPFTLASDDYRIIPGDVKAGDLTLSHISTNFDRTGFQQDINVVFPLDRLRELAEKGVIESVADYHYSFMGATNPLNMETQVRYLAGLLKKDRVNTVLLVPV